MKRTFMSAVLLATLGLSAAQAQVCNGHDGPIQSFASGTAQWPGIDFGPSVATMSNVAVNLVEKDGHKVIHLTYTQIRPLGYLKSALYAEIRNPNQEIKLVGIWGVSNRPDPPRTMEFTSNTPVVDTNPGTAIYLSVDCSAGPDPRSPNPPPTGGSWINLNCNTDAECTIH